MGRGGARPRLLRAGVFFLALTALTACGGGGGGDGPTPPPVNNNPASVRLSQAGPLTLSSGATNSVTADVLTSDGRTLSGVSVSWSSSDATIARVQDGAITALKVGTASITATASGISSPPLSVTVTPGSPARLGIRTQPAGATVAVPLTTQPVIELRDANDNVVTSATATVTASLASGGGTLSGTTTVTTVGGVAQFNDLMLIGLVGARTLTFAADGVAGATSSPFALNPGAPSQVAIARQPVGGAIGAPLLVQPAVELRDVSGNLATTATTPVVVSVSFGGGTVGGGSSVAPVNGVALFTDLFVTGAAGYRELTFTVAGLPAVTSTRFTLAVIVYGTSGQKIQYLDVGASASPTSSAAVAPAFVSRAATLVGVDNSGRITGRKEGQSWIVSTIAGGSDSVMTIVPRAAGGPILRTNISTYSVQPGETVTVDLILDPRTNPVGATNLFVTAAYDTTNFVGTATVLSVSGSTIIASQPTPNVYRFSIASATGITTPITFGRLQFTAASAGEVVTVSVTALDIVAPDKSDLKGRTTSTYYPLIVR